MKKITLLSLIAATAIAFSYTNAENSSPKAKHSHAKKKHHKRKGHHKHEHRILTQEEFNQKKKEKIEKLNTAIEAATKEIAAHASADPVAIKEAELKISEAKKWVQTIESYQDPITHLMRSFNIAHSEIESIEKGLSHPLPNTKDLNPTQKEKHEKHIAHSKKHNETVLEEINKMLTEVTALETTIPVEHENKACLIRILETAKEYTTFAAANQEKAHFKWLTKRAKRLLKIAKAFLAEHKSGAHLKHAAAAPVTPPAAEVKAPANSTEKVETKPETAKPAA